MNIKVGERKYYAALSEIWSNRRKRVEFFLFLILLVLFWVTRLWKLSELPYGLHIDEASTAYSAWTLAEYGVDRYLNPWPVYVPNADSGQSAMYVYLCAGLFKIFGYHLILVRIPAVFFSFLNFIFGMLTARKIFPENNLVPFAVGGLTVVCPYFILAGRFGLDCNLMMGMSTVFLYCFVHAVEDGRIDRYIVAGVTGGLVLYTYALSYIALPVFLILALIYLIRAKRFSLKGWFAMAVPMGILAFPLILVQIVNICNLEQFQIGCFTITKLGKNRAEELGNFSYEKLYNVFNVIFQGDVLNYNTAPGYKNFYGLTILFFLIGLVFILRKFWKSIKKRKLECQTFILLWFVSMILIGTLTEANVNRMNGVFYSVIFFTAVGINGLCRLIKKHSAVVVGVVGAVYLLCFGKFANYYFGGTYTEENFPLSYFDVSIIEAADFIEQDNVLSSKTTQMAEQVIYYMLEKQESPYNINVREIEETHRFGNYMFGVLGEIDDQCNYIVREDFDEYSEELRAAGFAEERYERYSLFYKK